MLSELSPEELQERIEQGVIIAMSKIPPPKKEEVELLTRADLAQLFGVSYVTIGAWCNKGILRRHFIGSRVYFLKSEVMLELTKKK